MPMTFPSRLAAALALAAVTGCAGTPSTQQDAAMQTGSAGLANSSWKILSMAGEPVKSVQAGRVPQITLRSADGRDAWSATVGCNRMSGGLSVNGDRIEFKAGMSTLMACPPPLDALEKQLGRSLIASTHWRIQGNRLELLDDAGVQTFLCEAVPHE